VRGVGDGVPQRGVPGVGARCDLGRRAGGGLRLLPRWQLHLVRDVTGFDEAQPFAGLRGELFHDKHRNALREAHQAIVDGLKAAAEG
jgi:hypothetical protein